MSKRVCVVDSKRDGFQCVNPDKFIPYLEGKDLSCISPSDTERLLKGCKAASPLPTLNNCTYDQEDFLCSKGGHLTPVQAENYLCLTHKDRSRIAERCQLEGMPQ